MRVRLSSSSGQFLLLLVFCILIVGIWITPVLLAGFPPEFTTSVKAARHYALTGDIGTAVSPFFTLVLRVLLPLIDWRDATGWAMVSAITLSAAVIPLWWSIARLFGRRIAWAAIFIFCFMPVQWQEAVSTGYYPLALLCLFSGFALFLWLAPRSRPIALAALGFCFGLTLGSAHAFFAFLPWFVGVYVWERRAHWKRAIVELALFGVCVYAGFVLPLLPTALQPGLTPERRLAVLLPLHDNLLPPIELYGDEYAFRFLREEFNKRMERQAASSSFLERRDNENFRIIYHVGSFHPLRVALNGAWLFLNTLASLFMQEIIGGVFLWLFILPGAAALSQTHRQQLFQLIGLWLSMELVLRFGFHYGRTHFMDVSWIAAILAGAGVLLFADAVHRSQRWVPLNIAAAGIVLLVSMQLVQENRKVFAQWYLRSPIPRAMAAAQALASVPQDAVIAQPAGDTLLAFSDHTSILLHSNTIDVLAKEGRLADPFRYYGITHIIGYDAARTSLILDAMPSVQAVNLPAAVPIPLNPFKRHLLNVIR